MTAPVTVTYLAVSVVTFLALGLDKRRACRGGWRISERTLHGLEALGGFPGSFVAQRLFRHKTRKRSYQAVFWLIVLAHAAFWGWWLFLRSS